jgi:hypothetical protein
VATSSAHAVGPSDASVVVVLALGSDSAMPLVLALRTPVFVLQMLVLLASGTALRLLSLVPCRLGVGLRLCATPRYVQRCHQGPLLRVPRMLAQTLSFYLGLL